MSHSIAEIFLRVLVHLVTDFFSSIMLELIFTKFCIFLESIVKQFKSSLDTSVSQIMGNKMIFSFFGLLKPMAMKSHLLNDNSELREDSMSIERYLGCLHFLSCPQVQYTMP